MKTETEVRGEIERMQSRLATAEADVDTYAAQHLRICIAALEWVLSDPASAPPPAPTDEQQAASIAKMVIEMFSLR